MITTQVWVRREIPSPSRSILGTMELSLETCSFPDIEEHELLVEPLFSYCDGHAGVIRVLSVGSGVKGIREGEIGLLAGAPVLGLLAKRTKISAQSFLPMPPDNPYSYAQWASYSVRYITAWSNWKVAWVAYRSRMSEDDDPAPHVWGWGGGTTFAELDLARRHGCRPTMVSASEARLSALTEVGIPRVDGRRLPDIELDAARYGSNDAYRSAYLSSEEAFLSIVDERTGGRGVGIFIDYVGAPVLRASLKALGRQGVLCTAGWARGTTTSAGRAIERMMRHVRVYTHHADRSEWREAVAYSLRTGWMPSMTEVLTWDEVPLLARHAASSTVLSYCPVFAINAP